MLRYAKMAGLVKLRCSVDPCRQRPEWAGSASWIEQGEWLESPASYQFATRAAKVGYRTFLSRGMGPLRAERL
jgi:hypothetical protein